MSRNKPKPGTVLYVHADPAYHPDGRGTAGTARIVDGRLVNIAGGIDVHPYPSGTATWSLPCQSCSVNPQRMDYALLQDAVTEFALNPNARRVEIDISNYYD